MFYHNYFPTSAVPFTRDTMTVSWETACSIITTSPLELCLSQQTYDCQLGDSMFYHNYFPTSAVPFARDTMSCQLGDSMFYHNYFPTSAVPFARDTMSCQLGDSMFYHNYFPTSAVPFTRDTMTVSWETACSIITTSPLQLCLSQETL